MRFVTYEATPGLEQFPERERFGLWRSTHKRLLREDDAYGERVRRFKRRLMLESLFSVVAPTALILTVTFAVLPAVQRHTLLFRLSIGFLIVFALASMLYVLITVPQELRRAIEIQQFMNERIGSELPKAV